MKKIRFACLAMLAPLALLCACTAGTPELSIESNWYLQTGERHVISPTSETLTYKIAFTASEEAVKAGYYFTYENGTFVTTLKDELIPLEDGTSARGYKFSTALSASVTVHYAGELSEAFENTLKTEVLFLDADSGLKPVKSSQEVHETIPAGMPASKFDSLTDAYRNYDYSFTTTYNADCSEAYIKLDNLATDEDDETEAQKLKLKGSGTYLDNEQILFALRGLDLASTSTFRTVNPNAQQSANVTFSGAPVAVRESCTFLLEGENTTAAIDAYEFNLTYSGQEFAGQSKKFVYAKKTSPTNNVYRNALLRLEQPFLHSHGNFVYTISAAEFTK